jgi:hypothetical protein
MRTTARRLLLVALMALGACAPGNGAVAGGAPGGGPGKPPRPKPPLTRARPVTSRFSSNATRVPRPTPQRREAVDALIKRNLSDVRGALRQRAPSRASRTGRVRSDSVQAAPDLAGRQASSSQLSDLRDSYSPVVRAEREQAVIRPALARLVSAATLPPRGTGARGRSVTFTEKLAPFATEGKYAKFGLSQPLDPRYTGENVTAGRVVPRTETRTRYLNDAQRAGYELTVRRDRDGVSRVYDALGKPFDTRNAISAQVGGARGAAIFVMDANGRIFASTFQEAGFFHHSSLSAGRPVAAAGEITVINGVVTQVTNRSGHYRPEPKFTTQLLLELSSRGIDTSRVQVVDVAR